MTIPSIIVTEPYRPRPIRFLDVWRAEEWRLKVYGIAYERAAPCPKLLEAAKVVARDRLATVTIANHYSVGFLGVHQGRTANFVFVDWWADENELHHHVYVSPTAEPEKLQYVTPTGLVACVWDLRVMAFERQAWLDHVLQNPRGPNLEAYLEHRLNEDA
jgi:hypothetical protein